MEFKQLKQTLTSLVLVAALVGSALAQQPSSSTPSVDRIRQVITYLASDALEGRRTGTPGANDAAHYIAGEMNRYGLRPGMQVARPARTRGENQARYLQPFPYVAGVELGKNNMFFVSEARADIAQLRIGEDWMPLGFSASTRVENANAVFVGYSIVTAEQKYDDYADVDAVSKVALAFEGTPDGDNPHGKFAQFEDVRFKSAAARDHGAKGLIVIARDNNFKEDRLSRLHYEHMSGDAGFPVAVISRQVAAKLLTLDGPEVLARMESTISSWVLGGGVAANCKEPCGVTHNFKPAIAGSVNISVDLVRRESPSFNVVGILPGSDPKLKNEAIVIGAHYDHLGRGGEGSLAPREGEIHHGADDNASGVAGLLELARMLATQNPKPRRTIVFIAFSGEEEGLIGSNYYVNHPVVPLTNTVAMINMDMIGRLRENKLNIGGVGTAQDWRRLIDKEKLGILAAAGPSADNNPREAGGGFAASKFAIALSEDGYGPSDHSSFYARQVPVLFFWTGNHQDYHKPSDTADKINYEGEARVISFVADISRDIDKSDKRPTYTVAKSESQGRTMGFRVYLGTIPNYADSNDGLKLDGVRDDSPASKAGLKAGDKIVKMAGREVKNVYDYTYALGEMKAGQEYEVVVLRGSERLSLKIVPAARK